MTFSCASCKVYWRPEHAKDGKCPECGRATTRVLTALPTLGVEERYRAAVQRHAERHAREQRRREFEAYCAERDRALLAELEREIASLPEIEPPGRAA